MCAFERPAIRREPGAGLIIHGTLRVRTVANEEDAERVAAFNSTIHGAGVGEIVRRLMRYHPLIQPGDFILVEDEETGQVVSSLSCNPWRWRYDGEELLAGEMGFVGTLEPYRGRGLVRAQVGLFKEMLRERGYHLSHIQGIPYYYRQFGYEYALPLESNVRLDLYQVPPLPEGVEPTHTCRPAVRTDFPDLVRLYTEATWDLDIYAKRDKAIWRYIWEQTPGTNMEAEIWMVEDRAGQPAGYFRVQKHPFGEGLTPNEVSRLSHDAALVVLRQLVALARERDKPYIRLNLSVGCTLVQEALALGAYNQGSYAWQIHIPDPVHLLRAIGPALERRVAASTYAGLTADLRIHLFRKTLLMRWREGRLADVTWMDQSAGWTLRLPPSLLAPVILGHWSWEELRRTRPDVAAAGEWVSLLDVLFPPMRAYIYQIY
jgi:predicted N-acetyltransferase YhbS